MNKSLTLIFLLLVSAAFGQQVSKKKAKAGKKIAIEMCNCTNGMIKTFHPVVRNFLNDMLTKSEAEAQANLLEARKKLTPAEMQRLKQDSERMINVNSGLSSNCLNDMKRSYNDQSDSEILAAMYQAINTLPKCKLTAKLMELGLKKKGK